MKHEITGNNDGFEIAPGITDQDWKKLELKNSPKYEKYWNEAIRIVELRLLDRYFEPCQELIDRGAPPKKEDGRSRYGFAIMAINCLLVETLQSFFEGLPTTRDESKALFRRFLTSNDPFKQHFNPDQADRFFEDVRCGILHIGQTHRGSLIKAKGPLVTINSQDLIIIEQSSLMGCVVYLRNTLGSCAVIRLLSIEQPFVRI